MNLFDFHPVYICETGFDFSNEGGENMDEFEKRLKTEKSAVERFVKFRISNKTKNILKIEIEK